MKKLFTTEPILPAQIADWKEQHKTRELHFIEVPVSDEKEADFIGAYFRNPTIEELGLAVTGGGENKLKTSQILYNTCLLGGHPDFETDQAIMQSAMKQFGQAIKTREGRLKKV